MPVAPLDVGIVGAGTAGASAALLLARAEHRVRVYEAVTRPGPVGAGIMLQPSGMEVLARLGLLPSILERGSVISRLRCVTPSGWTVLDLAYARYHTSAFGLGLHRGVLFEELISALAREPRVEVRCGEPVETIRTRSGRHQLFGPTGRPLGDHDLVVVAGGARSRLRGDTRLTVRDRRYPWGALWCVLQDPVRIFDGELFQVVKGTRHMLGFLPSGVGPTGDVPLVSLFWSVHENRVQSWRDREVEAWKATVRRYAPQSEALLAQIREPEQLLFARYHDVVMRRWHVREGVVYIGDAAHATSPQLGQGANLALVDAAALADALDDHDRLADALDAYSARRRRQLDYYQWATRFLTPFFQSDLAPLGWLRNAFMGLACKLPFVGTKMVRTMCGLEQGIFRGAPRPLPKLPRPLPARGTARSSRSPDRASD